MIKGNTQLLAVLGHPISHSASPAMHNAMIQHLNLDYVYVPFDVHPESLQEAITGLKALNVRGANVTVPLKEKIIPYLQHLDESAAVVGAVNTIVNQSGEWVGYNTDGLGFIYAMKHGEGFDFKQKKIVILGAGGTAKSLSVSCLKEGPQSLHIINRTLQRALDLKEHINTHLESSVLSVLDYSHTDYETVLAEADLVINTTSVGMAPDLEQLPIPDMNWLRPTQYCYDVIYNPARTAFLKAAEKKGARCINGSQMLVGQAVEAFYYFTGHKADFSIMMEGFNSVQGQ